MCAANLNSNGADRWGEGEGEAAGGGDDAADEGQEGQVSLQLLWLHHLWIGILISHQILNKYREFAQLVYFLPRSIRILRQLKNL